MPILLASLLVPRSKDCFEHIWKLLSKRQCAELLLLTFDFLGTCHQHLFIWMNPTCIQLLNHQCSEPSFNFCKFGLLMWMRVILLSHWKWSSPVKSVVTQKDVHIICNVNFCSVLADHFATWLQDFSVICYHTGCIFLSLSLQLSYLCTTYLPTFLYITVLLVVGIAGV